MLSRRLIYILGAALAAALLWWGINFGMSLYHKHQGAKEEQVSQQQHQEAVTHSQIAQAIPDHTAEIKAAEARAKASEAQSKRLQRERDELLVKLAAGPATTPDTRDEVIAKDKEVIGALVTENTDLKAQVGTLTIALIDRTKQYDEMTKAFQHEQMARQAQEAATEAWKKGVKEARSQGRIEGGGAMGALWIATHFLSGGKL